MSGRELFLSHPGTRFTSADSKRAVSAQHTPAHNRLLAALPPEDYLHLLPYLEPVVLPQGWTVHGAGYRETYLYFIIAGVVSKCFVMENGATTHFAVTGSEGVIGVASFLGGASTSHQAVVLIPGCAFRLGVDRMKNDFEHYESVRHQLLRYTQALMAQTAQTAVCNRHHALPQQLCGWILACLDRLPTNELPMTQELIANVLGVRREGVTEAAGKLQKAGLIHYRRGRITVLDRPRLEAQACECYAMVKSEYDRLLCPKDVIDTACAQRTHHQHLAQRGEADACY